MIDVTRYANNPILSPNSDNGWEAKATFNGCPIKKKENIYFLYRALSLSQNYKGKNLELSTIGLANSCGGINFNNRHQFIKPEHDWEKYGCEDARVVKLENKYFIFYTAISNYPPTNSDIKVGLAISPDLKKITSKHLITPFNAKAMTLFPNKINGQIVAILTAQTDRPPANIAIAKFNQISNLWNPDFWEHWHKELEIHTLRLQRRPQDHVEVGAPPIKTAKGWLLIYSYINNFFDSPNRIFTIEAALLDHQNPKKIIGRSKFPLLIPEKKYELNGIVPNVVFPSGALVKDEVLNIYYGAADTYCCLANCSITSLLKELTR